MGCWQARGSEDMALNILSIVSGVTVTPHLKSYPKGRGLKTHLNFGFDFEEPRKVGATPK
jgi:hypothetical protein